MLTGLAGGGRYPARVHLRMLAAVGLLMLVALPAAATEHGLQMQADTGYVVQPEAGRVQATTKFSLANTLPDKVTAEGRTRYYFESFSIPVPDNVESVSAADGAGRLLEVVLAPPAARVRVATITFPRIFFGDSIEVEVRYDIPGASPRSEFETRVNPAFVWFTAWAYGDPGLSSVTVDVPEGFVIETVGSPIGDDLVARAIEDPHTWAAAISARRDDLLARRSAGPVEIGYWPGDDGWAEFVAGIFSEGVPILEDLIGEPWPDGDLEVIESYGPSLLGYAGWYLPAEGRIEIGEELNPSVTLHEATHAWFNAGVFSVRWINEGLAEVYARAALARLGLPPDPPGAPEEPKAFALNDWAPAKESEADPYGYAASHWVIHSIAEEVGFDGLRAVLGSAFAKTIPYPTATRQEVVDLPQDWRGLLDRLENLAGAETAADLFRSYVLTGEQAAELDRRSAARAEYAAFLQSSYGWGAPLEVRMALSEWEWDEFERLVGTAREVLAARVEVDERAAVLAVSLPRGQEIFEGSSLATSAARFQAEREVVDLVISASNPDPGAPGFLESIGLISADTSVEGAVAALEVGDLVTAERIARDVLSVYSSARDTGIERSLGLSAVLSVLLGAGMGLRSIRADA